MRPVTLEISGTVDYKSAGEISARIDELVAKGHKFILLDCSGADFFDSCGISLLARVGSALLNAGGRLQVKSPGPQLKHALEIAGFTNLVDLIETEQAQTVQERQIGRTHQRVSLRLPPSADRDGHIRHRVMELAESLPFTTEQLDDIKLAVGEAVTNAIRHSTWRTPTDRIKVKASADDSGLTVEVTNPADLFDTESRPLPQADKLRAGGLGIYFMRACMDSVDYSFKNGWATVKMVKHLRSDNNGK